MEELQENFHLPINEVACKLGVCVTVLKQQCRELGIIRWPYRKVREEALPLHLPMLDVCRVASSVGIDSLAPGWV